MRSERSKTALRCAVYTRVSTEHGLEQEFNSLDNQREASEAYVKSQAHEGWKLIRTRYDDGGYSAARWRGSPREAAGRRSRSPDRRDRCLQG
jgi:DNA invertase Pin-like site-specific DNA recombinase